MTKAVIVHQEHACQIEYPDAPPNVSTLRAKWSCPICKQRWVIKGNKNLMYGYKVGFRRRWKG